MNVGERLTAMTMLPQEGSFVTIQIVRDLSKKLGITAEEYKEFEIKEDNGKVFWNAKGNEDREIELADVEITMLKDALKKLDDANKLTQQHFSLYEKFVMKG